MQLYQNIKEVPSVSMGQFLFPFLEEQVSDKYVNPFIFNNKYKDAWIDDPFLV